jgi:predicted HicB family RNase H-like nuclease
MQSPDKSARAHVRLRLPPDLKEWVSLQAEQHGGSLNSEIVRALVQHKKNVESAVDRRRERKIA